MSRSKLRLTRLALPCLLAAGLPAAAGAAPAALYVDCVNGSDATGAGTLASPWQTIQKGADSAAPGDTVNVLPGRCDGTNQPVFPIVMRSDVSVAGAGLTLTF